MSLSQLPSVLVLSSRPLYELYNLTLRSEVESESRHLSNGDFSLDFDPTSTECVSPLIEWSMEKIADMGYDIYKELYDNKILQMPFTYKHHIDKNEDEERFGLDGSLTFELKQRHRETIAFWTEADVDDSIETEKILLLSMHGSDLMDNNKLVPTIIHMFDFHDENDILAFASKVQDYVQALPNGYDNPLLTMNAVATRGGSRSSTSSTLIIGDGVLQFLDDSKLTESGPDFVHAHEFGHHLQYEMDLEHSVPEGYEDDIRRKELMADAISAYFLAHDRGGNMDPHEISQFSMTAFATGDCNIGQEDHHGTPKQRSCASVWGASRAALADDGESLIDPDDFVSMFNVAYSGMLDLDSQECILITEEPDDLVYSVASQTDVIDDEAAHQPDASTQESNPRPDTISPSKRHVGVVFSNEDTVSITVEQGGESSIIPEVDEFIATDQSDAGAQESNPQSDTISPSKRPARVVFGNEDTVSMTVEQIGESSIIPEVDEFIATDEAPETVETKSVEGLEDVDKSTIILRVYAVFMHKIGVFFCFVSNLTGIINKYKLYVTSKISKH